MIAYFDCFSGISGDMTLGALFDLGVPVKWLQESLQQDVPLSGFDLSIESVQRHGINGQRVRVRVNDRQAARNYNDITRLIESSRLSDFVKKTGLDMFERIADAEAGIHGCPKAEVGDIEVHGSFTPESCRWPEGYLWSRRGIGSPMPQLILNDS